MSTTTELNPNAKLWVEALESGKYKQGRHYLHRDDFYCCLGVACELAIKAGIKLDVVTKSNGVYCYNSGEASLPFAVRDWLGLKSIYGQFSDPDKKFQIPYLTKLNDCGMPFNEIAQVIRAKPQDLFNE